MKPDEIQLKEALGYRQFARAAALTSSIAMKWQAVQAAQKSRNADELPDLMDSFVDMQMQLVRLYLVDESCMGVINELPQSEFYELYGRVMDVHTGEVGTPESDPLPTTSMTSAEDTSTEPESS